MVLNEILESKRKEISDLKHRLSLEKIRTLALEHQETKRSLLSFLTQKKNLHLICELKKASPSEGIIRRDFNPKIIAAEFESEGASAISILTEKHFFQGNPETIRQIRPLTHIPLLRKDFILDSYQLYETALLGADAFLIIAMLVSDEELKQMLAIAAELRLETLIEVHTKEELDLALKAGAQIIGINNRDLKTLRIDVTVAEQLIPLIPKGIVVVIESGIKDRDDIVRFQKLGVCRFLVGTSLMKAADIKKKIRELTGIGT